MLQHLKSTSPTRIGICISVAFLLATTYLLLPVSTQAATWSIDSFDSVVQIHEDASITVIETIDTTFNIEKHGIYREIPTRYTDSYGNSYKTDLDILSVLQDGGSAQTERTYGYSDVNIRIGDPDRYITESHTYEITYTVDRVFLYFDDYDEFYWNVTGDEWEVPIDHTSATIILPDGAVVEQFECYTGFLGSTAQDCTKFDRGDTAQFQAEDFLTVAVGFTKGFIYEPTAFERFVWLVLDNWFGLVPIILLVLTFWMWWRYGRDPKMTRSIIAEYEPPLGIKAVYAGWMAFGKPKKDLFATMIVQMAVDGALSVETQELDKAFKLLRRGPEVILHPKDGPEGLDVAHAQLYEILFKGRKEPQPLSRIKGTIQKKKLIELRKIVQQWVVQEGYYVEHSFARQGAVIIGGFILCGLSVVIVPTFFGLFSIVCGVVSGIGIMILGFLMPSLTPEGLEVKRKILGFKEFMHTAERYRSAWHEKENIFADYLPYAIAFDDVQKWAKTFEGVSQAAPDWYTGHMPLMVLASSGEFNSITSSIRSATSTPNSTGASGGGGSSGGGFGGGGGGSW